MCTVTREGWGVVPHTLIKCKKNEMPILDGLCLLYLVLLYIANCPDFTSVHPFIMLGIKLSL